jgi:hypothetical protein
LRYIESTGPTVLTYANEEEKVVHTLTCPGLLTVDHQLLKTTLECPRDQNNNVLFGKQIVFHDSMGEIYADLLTVYYTMAEDSPTPTKLVLEGNVQMFNRGGDPDKNGAFLQYALADVVEYTPQAREVYLVASDKKRVLFFDKLNALQVSATSLKIRRDQETKKESIQGFGDVRFSFVEKELEMINKMTSTL